MKNHAGLLLYICMVETFESVKYRQQQQKMKKKWRKRWKEKEKWWKMNKVWVLWWGGLLWGPSRDDVKFVCGMWNWTLSYNNEGMGVKIVKVLIFYG